MFQTNIAPITPHNFSGSFTMKKHTTSVYVRPIRSHKLSPIIILLRLILQYEFIIQNASKLKKFMISQIFMQTVHYIHEKSTSLILISICEVQIKFLQILICVQQIGLNPVEDKKLRKRHCIWENRCSSSEKTYPLCVISYFGCAHWVICLKNWAYR